MSQSGHNCCRRNEENEDKGRSKKKSKKAPPEAGLIEKFGVKHALPETNHMLGHHTLDGFHRVGIDHRCSIFEPVRGTFEGHVPSATKNQMISDIKYVVVLVLFLLVSWKGFKEKPFFQKGIKKIAGKKGAP